MNHRLSSGLVATCLMSIGFAEFAGTEAARVLFGSVWQHIAANFVMMVAACAPCAPPTGW
jgi:hypothetical protein